MLNKLITLVSALWLSACQEDLAIQHDALPGSQDTEFYGFSTLVATPGESVQMSGSRLRAGEIRLTLDDQPIDLSGGGSLMNFTLPEALARTTEGGHKLKVYKGETLLAERSIVVAQNQETRVSTLISELSESSVCVGVRYQTPSGSAKIGTKDCKPLNAEDVPYCKTDGEVGCISHAAFPSVDKAQVELLKSRFSDRLKIAGIEGAMSACDGDSTEACYLAPYSPLAQTNKAFDPREVTGAVLRQGVSLGGITGSVVPTPAACGADGAMDCVTRAAYPSFDAAQLPANRYASVLTLGGSPGQIPSCVEEGSGCYLMPSVMPHAPRQAINMNQMQASKIKLGTSFGGVVGTMPLALADCTGDGQSGCLSTTDFPAVASASVQAIRPSFGSTQQWAGISGQLDDCDADADVSCRTVATFPSGVLSELTSKSSRFAATLTLGGVVGTMVNCAAGDSDCRLPTYAGAGAPFKAIDQTELVAANILGGHTVGGVSGSLAAQPVACGGDGVDACLTNTNYPAIYQAGLDGQKTLFRTNVTLGGVTGQLDLCSADGGLGCVSSTNYPAVLKTGVDSGKANFPASLSLGGVAGTFTGHVACIGLGSNCTMATYAAGVESLKALDVTPFVASAIRSGQTLGGVAGQYPSATYPLTPGDAHLELSNFNSQIALNAMFGWFDATGQRHTGQGSTNLLASNLGTTITLGGVTGTIAVPKAWDVRRKSKVSDNVTGRIFNSCRSIQDLNQHHVDGQTRLGSVSSSVFTIVNHGWENDQLLRSDWGRYGSGGIDDATLYGIIKLSNDTFRLYDAGDASKSPRGFSDTSWLGMSRVNGGVGGQDASTRAAAWPTVTSANNPFAPSIENFCVQNAHSASERIFEDVTVGGCASGKDCRYLDRNSGLEWSKVFQWYRPNQAVKHCENLTFDGATGWRLPTQMEIITVGTHGIRSIGDTNYMSLSDTGSHWISSTKRSNYDGDSNQKWAVRIEDMDVTGAWLDQGHRVVCVRKH